MINYKQEIVLDFQSFKDLVVSMGKSYFENDDLQENYNNLRVNLNKYHILCLDKNVNTGISNWVHNYKLLLEELNDIKNYPLGPHIVKMLESHITIKMLQDNSIIYYISKDRLKEVEIELAQKSSFKVLVDESDLKPGGINKFSFNKFGMGYLPDTLCTLLRKEIIFKFNRNDNLNLFLFLQPYLFFAKKIIIKDKYLSAKSSNCQIINLILSYVKSPVEIVLELDKGNNRFNLQSDNDLIKKNVDKIYSVLHNKYPELIITLIDNTKAHPRTIATEYSIIDISHTLDILYFQSHSLFTNGSISFIMTLKNENNN